MPLRVYQASGEAHCQQCLPGFERLEKMDATALTHCPHCAAEVRRCVSAPSVINADGSLLTPASLEKHGFTQYRKVGQGEYERSAGSKGPSKLKA
ncbi:MAG: zinc ribbon domain-containing protein [Gammaproteobacteria bacterium]|nr:zinc ribbon domain-containing protein [Gammaproteobacteria bacterium]